MPTVAPYGSWSSPITAAEVARSERLVRWLDFVGDELWWAEMRPAEGGRMALVRLPAGGPAADVLPAGWDVRNRVHGYGGRSWLAVPGPTGHTVVFTNRPDGRVYRMNATGETGPVPISPVDPAANYADFAACGEEVWCVRELRMGAGVRRELVAIPLQGGEIRVLARSHRFLTGPRISPDGRRFAWIGWDRPRMPWDGSELMVAEVAGGPARVVTGGAAESIAQVEWADDCSLYAVSDRDGWWNVHRVLADGSGQQNLCPRAEDFGGPLWQIGTRWFDLLEDGRLAVIHGTGRRALGVLDPLTGQVDPVGDGYTDWSGITASGAVIAGVAGNVRREPEIAVVELAGRGVRMVRPGGDGPRPGYLSEGELRFFALPNGRSVPVFLYPPRNQDFLAPHGERPPYVLFAHGGPTSGSGLVADREVAYYTSRGIGVADVQYAGSTGFGRAYRELLRHNWGVLDVRDCEAVARALVAEELADAGRLAIHGRSAGGYTAAMALCQSEVFRCAALYFPILDLPGWRTGETHDFEEHYLESLVGPWPEQRREYERRSPSRLAYRVRAPFVLFHGAEDTVCPPAQAARFSASVSAPHTYREFPGEPHGFRLAETTETTLRLELALYAEVFGFTVPPERTGPPATGRTA